MIRSPPSSTADRGKNVKNSNKTCDPIHKCSTCNVIINELLAYIADKVDILHEKGLVQICTSTYTLDEIEEARQLVFSLLAPTKRLMRRKEGSEDKSIQEIIKIIKEFEPSQLPLFVAKTLSKLPPVTFDYVDVTAFLKELSKLRWDMEQLKASSKRNNHNTNTMHNCATDIEELKTDLDDIKKILSSQATMTKSDKIHQDCNIFNENKTHLISEQAHRSNSKPVAATSGNTVNNRPPERQLSPVTCTSPPRPARPLHIDKPARAPTAQRQMRSRNNSIDGMRHTPSYRDMVIRKTQTNEKPLSKPIRVNIPQQNDFILVEHKRRKKNNNLCGSAPVSSKLTVADQSIAIYVSRLAKCTTAEQLKEYIMQDKGEECTGVQLLDQKHGTEFNSFKVTINKSRLDAFLASDFWPEGIKYRKYRERFAGFQKLTQTVL